MFSPMRPSSEILHDGLNSRVHLVGVRLRTDADVAHVLPSSRTQQAMVRRYESYLDGQGRRDVAFLENWLERAQRCSGVFSRYCVFKFSMQQWKQWDRKNLVLACSEFEKLINRLHCKEIG